jgi:hypothetical protein
MREIEARLFKEKESLAAFHARERDILAQLSNLEEEVAKKKVSHGGDQEKTGSQQESKG